MVLTNHSYIAILRYIRVEYELGTQQALEPGSQEHTNTMNAIRRFFHVGPSRQTSSRFNRYYLGVLQTGSGYPTADEARKDLKNYDKTFNMYGWPR
jgi:hypothetical protein